MLPFSVELKTGAPVSEQVIYAVKKAVISGHLQPGLKFPSVRVLSQELRINPNTAHKIVSALTQEGILEVQPGIGTLVAPQDRIATAQQRTDLLGTSVERLVVEARNLNLDLEDIQAAVGKQWNKLTRGGRKS